MSKSSSPAGPRATASRAPVGLTDEQITAAAMEVLESDGLDKLSLRGVAARLGVRVNAVAWHLKDKTGLLEAVADAIVANCVPAHLPPDPEERVRALLTSLRTALLSHRDGARLAQEGSSLARPHQRAFAEAFNAALHATGRSPQEAAWTAWTLMYFTLGLVKEEQTPPNRTLCAEAAEADPTAFPSLAKTIAHLMADSFDDRFAYGVDLILSGRSAVPSAPRPAPGPQAE
ncbi:TetR/AcrR family transcriptional regulator C-terminal domain-containing protein [Streptomyces bluensis]|uniref:TetR/AcrR family transcriptional regulator C-terminal domain-containing protein n=1 Tax=Streptomyces bluensis TaxID=33897 RepID=UPI00167659E5|nr:TetR/AcrR family transcriptional regulator C-terminal domain-containing protein [Streptomyces bluensis]GGZ41564.1 putative transcriptional regulator, TetR family protein [Streptomyces bluensis]